MRLYPKERQYGKVIVSHFHDGMTEMVFNVFVVEVSDPPNGAEEVPINSSKFRVLISRISKVLASIVIFAKKRGFGLMISSIRMACSSAADTRAAYGSKYNANNMVRSSFSSFL